MADLRWQLVDEGSPDPQGALFDQVAERHIGKGEYRGMEFLHVHARRIINEVPAASRMPFRYTINAYRGCSHACSYCLSGDTPVLMAGGGAKALADVRPGDEVLGVGDEVLGLGGGALVPTPVLDHWATVRPAHRVLLADGRELVASADHRFLTPAGWRRVGDLAAGQALCTVGRPGGGFPAVPVVSVADAGGERPLFDITTGAGDFVANGVISHNCFARPTHEYLGMNAGEDFDRRIVVKVNAAERLRAELAPNRWDGSPIAMGTNTDPYQRCEAKYRLTQAVVTELAAARNPFSILTKSTLILRDLDLLADAARRTEVRANFSVGTLDEEVWKLTEPGTPHPRQRLEAVARLNAAGVPCGVLVAPVLPGLSDGADQLEAVVEACVEAGATSITPLLLHLRPGVREHYLGWLAGARPDLLASYEGLYPRSYAPKSAQRALAEQVARAVGRHVARRGGRRSPPREAPPSPRPAPPPPRPRQLSLEV